MASQQQPPPAAKPQAPAPTTIAALSDDLLLEIFFRLPSTTREWQILPWTEDLPAQPSGKMYWLRGGTQASGLLCWSHAEEAYKVVLDTTTLQFSFIDLPEHLKGKGYLYMAGETKDGKLCIVSVAEFTLFVWLRRANADGVEKWMLDSEIPLELGGRGSSGYRELTR